MNLLLFRVVITVFLLRAKDRKRNLLPHRVRYSLSPGANGLLYNVRVLPPLESE